MADTTCTVEGCNRTGELRRGWCIMHYRRWRAHGSPNGRPAIEPKTCEAPDCNRVGSLRRGYCGTHYKRLRTRGDITQGVRIGEDHPHWTGESASYPAAHKRLAAKLGPARRRVCIGCVDRPAIHWAYDHTDPGELTQAVTAHGYSYQVQYSTDLHYYVPLCRSCHTLLDKAHRQASVTA